MTAAAAPDDVVATHAAAARNAREPLVVLEPLAAFLDERGLGEGELRVRPLGEGHSNVTYLVRRGELALVLRRPPRGPLPPSAHDVLREARLLRALEPTPVRVPRVLAVGDDPSIIGAPFFVMEHVEGHVVTGGALPAALDTPPQRRRIGEELVDALVEIHAVDWRACGLDGRPDGYLERQLRRFAGLWERARTRPIDAIEQVGAWLVERRPKPSAPTPATVVHGDYRLGNVMLAPAAPARLVAIFDWEMATIGDPLADVGYLCALWAQHDDPPSPFELSGVTRGEGFPDRDELVARYARRSGREVEAIRWYRVLALWKAAIFMEGNYRRAIAGTTDDPWLKGFAEGVLELAERARRLAQER